jgi:hypothetical protein
MNEACQRILAWLDKEFPGTTYPPEHWSRDDASEYLPVSAGVPPELGHEPIEMFIKRTAPPPAPCKELAVARYALEKYGAGLVLAALRSQGVAGRLRKVPARRLLLDRDLVVHPWGHSSRGDEESVMDPRD